VFLAGNALALAIAEQQNRFLKYYITISAAATSDDFCSGGWSRNHTVVSSGVKVEPVSNNDAFQAGLEVRELRKAVDAVRMAFNYGPLFVRATAPTDSVTAANLTALMTALNPAKQAAQRPIFSYTGVLPPAAGGVIRAQHILQLRAAVQ
jgi:hypothetical protein